ncbi:hypothetical protein [Streptomyces sp. H39-C1]|uniref:hypothetical protein n=1 Tax=Streptomyces sp. H39-C1 TaxID=3004355 RepID=UPI0022AF42CD|nr:hypothetical protein [Streptomyces sp. H39-C1]MCZ4102652.1 hypothetical protein [Streptomyces sp. H39-C1]
MLLHRDPQSAHHLMGRSQTFDAMREFTARYLEGATGTVHADRNVSQREAVCGQVLAWSSRAGYLPTRVHLSAATTYQAGMPAVLEGFLTDPTALHQLLSGLHTAGLAAVVHAAGSPGPVHGIHTLPGCEPLFTMGQHLTVQRFGRRLAAVPGQQAGEVWQVTAVAPTDGQLWTVLRQFSGLDRYVWSETGTLTVNDVDLSGSGDDVSGIYTRRFTHPSAPGVVAGVHHYICPADPGHHVRRTLSVGWDDAHGHRRLVNEHQVNRLGSGAWCSTWEAADTLARDLTQRLRPGDINHGAPLDHRHSFDLPSWLKP